MIMGRRAAGAAAVVGAAAAVGGVWATQRGGHAPAPAGELVAAQRGEVAVTVGGIGHVSTLTAAARLSVPAAAPASGGSSAGVATSTTTASSATAGGGGQTTGDAVFPLTTGHVTRLLVHTGDSVVAGQPIATLSDDGTTAGTVLQARSDLATARLELAQKRVQDPARGQPPTPAEVVAGRSAIASARAKLVKILGPPLPADVATARLDVSKAVADLRTAQSGRPAAVSAGELAVDTARHKLQAVTGSPDPADVATAQLDLAKATLDQDTLLTPAPGPSTTTVRAADLAIELAQAKLNEAMSSGTAVDVAAARADLAKAQSDRELLVTPPPPPTDAARTAAQLAVDAARRKLDAVLHPPAAVVDAARQELARSQSDLAALRVGRGAPGLAAARDAVTAARRRLAQVTGPPTPDVVPAARLDLRKAQADLAVLRQRGAPASATDLALARLKVDVADQRASLAQQLAGRLTVRAASTGTVTSVLTSEGAAVDTSTPVARVQDLSHLVVTLDLSEFDVSRTRVGAPAKITVDALGGREFGGRVIDVALSGNDNGGVVNFPVIVALRPHRSLRPGMSVRARLVVTSRPGVVRVPLAAVTDAGGHPTVVVGGRRRIVTVGLAGTQFVEVRSGLRPGERVLVAGGGG